MARRPLNGTRFGTDVVTIYLPNPQLTLSDWHQALEDLDTRLRDQDGEKHIRVLKVEGRVAHINVRIDLRHKE